LISWDYLDQWIFRVARNARYRQSTLSEPEAQPEFDSLTVHHYRRQIRRKNLHPVPIRADETESRWPFSADFKNSLILSEASFIQRPHVMPLNTSLLKWTH
jgi:hypothetical protein